MTRRECEKAIFYNLLKIKEIYDQYRGRAGYLSMTIFKDAITFNNERWPGGEDEAMPINFYSNIPVGRFAFNTPEGKILETWAKEHRLDPTEYIIIECDIKDIRRGDVITIQPACYDDLIRSPHVVSEDPVPYVRNGKVTGIILCGFVFEIPGTEIILRKGDLKDGNCCSL